jgi:RimJ/RimL family protein N-acetyltransferase
MALSVTSGKNAAMDDDTELNNVSHLVEDMAFTAELNDGALVRIRPIAPKDKERLQEGWRNLSERSRYLRFLHAKPSLSNSDLVYLTEIDYHNHFAWAAEALDSDDPPGIGIARYIRDPTDPTVAEAAIAVVDSRQRQGLGRILLEALSDAARDNGIERFRAYVSLSNLQVLKALTAVGAVRGHTEDGAVSLEMPLPATDFQQSAMYAALRAAAIHQTHSSDTITD